MVPQTTVTLDELKAALPSRKNSITQEAVDLINTCQSDPEFQGESLMNTVVAYENVLGKYPNTGVRDYINAIKFCAYLVSADDNATEAYKRTFYYRDFVKERMNVGTETPEYRELTKAASRYKSSKLVVDILTYSQVHMSLLFRGERYKVLGELFRIALYGKLEKDKVAAGKEFLAATKEPENIKLELDVGPAQSKAVEGLTAQLGVLAAQQLQLLQNGTVDLGTLGALTPTHEKEVIDGEYRKV